MFRNLGVRESEQSGDRILVDTEGACDLGVALTGAPQPQRGRVGLRQGRAQILLLHPATIRTGSQAVIGTRYLFEDHEPDDCRSASAAAMSVRPAIPSLVYTARRWA